MRYGQLLGTVLPASTNERALPRLRSLASLALASVTASLLSAAPALAAAAADHGHGHGDAHGADHHAAGIETLVWPAVNFALYVLLLAFLYRRFVDPALKARAASFDQQYRRAVVALEEAERELRQAQARFDGIAEEQAQIRARFDAEAVLLSKDILEAARRTAQQIEQDVSRRIESERAKVVDALRQEAVQRATTLARTRLERTLSEDDDFRLRHETLRGLF